MLDWIRADIARCAILAVLKDAYKYELDFTGSGRSWLRIVRSHEKFKLVPYKFVFTHQQEIILLTGCVVVA